MRVCVISIYIYVCVCFCSVFFPGEPHGYGTRGGCPTDLSAEGCALWMGGGWEKVIFFVKPFFWIWTMM